MYNPMMEYQRNQLLAQKASIESQLSQMGQISQMGQYPVQQTQPQFFVRQVGNVEEAKGFPVDPCTTYIFTDSGTGRIYVKKLNPGNGKSDFFTYAALEESDTDPMAEINARLSRIEAYIGGLNDKPVSAHAEPDGSHAKSDDGKDAVDEPADVRQRTANDKRKNGYSATGNG